MNKNKKYILIALLASLLFTVTIGFSVWIILSEQVRGHVQKMGEISFAPTLNSPTATYYAGEAAPFSYDPVIYSYYYNGESTPKQWEITGTAEINTLVGKGGSLTDGALDTECVITFRPTSPLAQWLWGETITATVTVKLLPVAQNGDVYYTTVDKALEGIQNASSGTVYVIPSGDYTNIEDPKTGRARFAKTITPVYDEEGKEVPREIPVGVTLMLPQATTVNAETGAISYSGTERNLSANGGFATSYSNKETYCTNVVSIASSLTCNGTIEVCGVINAAGEKQIAGQVYGKFGLLHLADGGTLSVNGTAKFFGFLEATDAYEAVQFNNGSTVQQSFLFYEYRSGGDTVAMVSSQAAGKPATMYCSPFYRYMFPNIIGSYTINYGAKFQAITAFNISKNLIAATINVMGNTNAYFVQMTNGASVKVRYDHDDKVGLNTYGTDTYGHSSWSITGGATINAIQVPVSISILTVTLTTSGVYLPIPYLLEIEFLNGSYNFPNQDVKVLPGGKLIVGEGATVTCKNLMLAKDPPPIAGDTKSAKIPYPTAAQLAANGLPTEGACEIRSGGQMILTAASGKFTAQGVGGILTVNSTSTSTSLELYGPGSAAGTIPYKGAVTGFEDTLYYVEVTAGDFPFAAEKVSEGAHATAGTYYSADRGNGTYGWYRSDMKVTFMANGSVYHTDASAAQTGYTGIISKPSDPSRGHYTFSHWCTNNGCVAGADCEDAVDVEGQTFFETTILYAAWIPNSYKLSYVFDNSAIAGATLPEEGPTNSNPSTFTYETNTPLEDATYGEFVFDGWYLDAQHTVNASDLRGTTLVNYLAGNTVTLYARWYPKGSKSYTINYVNSNTNGFNATYKGSYVGDNIANYAMVSLNGKNSDPTYEKYFLGWSTTENGAVISDLSNATWTNADTTNPSITLYAVWKTKLKVTIIDSHDATANYGPKTLVEAFYAVGDLIAMPEITERVWTQELTLASTKESTLHAFTGWSSSLDSISLTNGQYTVQDKDMGAYTAEPIEVTFTAERGTEKYYRVDLHATGVKYGLTYTAKVTISGTLVKENGEACSTGEASSSAADDPKNVTYFATGTIDVTVEAPGYNMGVSKVNGSYTTKQNGEVVSDWTNSGNWGVNGDFSVNMSNGYLDITVTSKKGGLI